MKHLGSWLLSLRNRNLACISLVCASADCLHSGTKLSLTSSLIFHNGKIFSSIFFHSATQQCQFMFQRIYALNQIFDLLFHKH